MSLFGTGRREGILAVLLLVALGLAIHVPGLCFGHHRRLVSDAPTTIAPSPGGAAARVDPSAEGASNDVILFPALRQAGNVWRSGEAPLWNPNARFGEPFSFSGASIWYPPYWIAMAGFGAWSFDLLLALHTVLACVGMYRFLRVMPMSRYVAFLGGGVYGLGWFVTAGLDRLPEIAAAAILPFALECTWRCLSKRRSLRIFVPTLAVLIALMFATGATTTAWLGLLLCVALLTTGLSAVEREHRVAALRMSAVVAGAAFLLCAPLWLEWLQHRGAAYPSTSTPQAPRLQPAGLLGLLAPNLFGDLRGHGPSALRDVNPAADPLELVLYPGAFVLFAGLIGLLRPKRSYQKLFWLIVGGVGLLLAVDSPLHEWIGWAPERPGAALVISHMAAVVLAGLSLETFLDAPMMRRFAATVACVISLALTLGFGLAFGVLPEWGDACVAWLTGSTSPGEVTAARSHVFWIGLPTAGFVTAMAIAFLTWRRVGLPRFKPVFATLALGDLMLIAIVGVPRGPAPSEEVAALPGPTAAHARHVAVGRGVSRTPGSWHMADGIPTVTTSGRAVLDRTARFLSAIDPSCVQSTKHRAVVAPLIVPALLDDPLLEIGAIGYASSAEPAATMNFRPMLAAPSIESAELAGPQVLMSQTPRPRARLVFAAANVEAGGGTTEAWKRQLAVAPQHVLVEGANPSFKLRKPADTPTLEWITDEANRIEIRVDVGDGRGFLSLADAHAPGWHATVDGEPADLLPCHVAFRAVPVREGTHTVEMVYRPWSWYAGIPLFLAGLMLCLGYTAWVYAATRYRVS